MFAIIPNNRAITAMINPVFQRSTRHANITYIIIMLNTKKTPGLFDPPGAGSPILAGNFSLHFLHFIFLAV